MKKIFIILVITFSVQSCKDSVGTSGTVQYSGNLSEVMGGKLDATITLNELKSKKNLYALGVMENLSGEIQIFNSQPLNSRRGPEKIEIDRNFQAKAALLVYAQVDEWQEIEVPKAILTMGQFESYIDYTAEKAGIDTSKPFPFLLQGYIRKLNWHIVNLNQNTVQRSHMDHIKAGLNGVTVEENVEILGFFSKDHQGVFTHHGSNVHMHFKSKSELLAAHLDDILLGEYMTLKLPKQ